MHEERAATKYRKSRVKVDVRFMAASEKERKSERNKGGETTGGTGKGNQNREGGEGRGEDSPAKGNEEE